MRPLAYKGTLQLAFERALRKDGHIPDDVAIAPTLTTSTWVGPRDRV